MIGHLQHKERPPPHSMVSTSPFRPTMSVSSVSDDDNLVPHDHVVPESSV